MSVGDCMGKKLDQPIALSNRDIRMMLKLAEADENDIFCDLGCGFGQLCIIAVKEFNVKHAVGIERLPSRVKKAKENVKRERLQKRISIIEGHFQDINLKEATIVYDGLLEEEDTLKMHEKTLRKGCKFITVSCPLVSILPDKADYPFYLMKFPFNKTNDATEWSSKVLFKQSTFEELLSEFKNDPVYESNTRLLKKLAKERFKFL